jgi:coenzyme F420-reducing hydrogenase gamma subunit
MSQNGKPKIAFFDFSCCEGCQLTVVDSLQDYLGLLDVVEIVQFREAISERGEDYAIAFIEGSCTRPSDEARLKKIREQAAVVVALGACAHLGGINTLKYLRPLEEARQYVYGKRADWFDTYDARPISAVITVDHMIPGCPIDKREFVACVKALLLGKKMPIPDYPMCVECKLNENNCMYSMDRVCIGPITRAGCGAICPSFGESCEGCRGFISNPNNASMQELLAKHGLSPDELAARYTLFNTYQVRETLLQRKNMKAETAGS